MSAAPDCFFVSLKNSETQTTVLRPLPISQLLLDRQYKLFKRLFHIGRTETDINCAEYLPDTPRHDAKRKPEFAFRDRNRIVTEDFVKYIRTHNLLSKLLYSRSIIDSCCRDDNKPNKGSSVLRTVRERDVIIEM